MFCNCFVSFNKTGAMRMLRPAILLSVVPLAPAPVLAQPVPVEQELTRLFDEWMRAVWEKGRRHSQSPPDRRFRPDHAGFFKQTPEPPGRLRTARMAGDGDCVN